MLGPLIKVHTVRPLTLRTARVDGGGQAGMIRSGDEARLLNRQRG